MSVTLRLFFDRNREERRKENGYDKEREISGGRNWEDRHETAGKRKHL